MHEMGIDITPEEVVFGYEVTDFQRLFDAFNLLNSQGKKKPKFEETEDGRPV